MAKMIKEGKEREGQNAHTVRRRTTPQSWATMIRKTLCAFLDMLDGDIADRTRTT